MLLDKNITFVINGKVVNDKLVYSNFVQSQFHSIKSAFRSAKIDVIQNGGSISALFKNALKLRKSIMPESIIHAQYGTLTALTVTLAKRNSKFVLSLCGDDILGSSRKTLAWRIRGTIGRCMSIFSCYFADVIIAKSPSIAGAVPRAFHRKIEIIPNGVDDQLFKLIDKDLAKKNLGWASDHKYVLFNPSAGHNTHVKNKPLAIEIIDLVRDEYPNIELVLIEKRSAEEINVMMNASDALLVTSFHEGSPNIVKEALCCNLPVVSVDCGDVKIRLQNVQESHCAASYDSKELSKLLIEVLDGGRRSNGRTRLHEDKLFISQIAERLLNVYKKL